MARGFESKSVADQQETAQAPRRAPKDAQDSVDPGRLAHRRRLELARVDVERRLAVAAAPAHRKMLELALRALDDELAALD